MPRLSKPPAVSLPTQKKRVQPSAMEAAGIPPGLMSSCQSAHLVRMGMASWFKDIGGILHPLSESDLHGSCRRSVSRPLQENGMQMADPCTCACHVDQPWKCLDCRFEDLDGTAINMLTGKCLNTVGCRTRQREAVDAWWATEPYGPMLSGMQEGDRLILEGAGLGPVLLCPGQCEHCGEDCAEDGVTSFLPKHEAKLKRTLAAAAAEGDPDSVAEMALRGWLDGYYRKKITEKALLQAETLLGGLDDPIQWALTRNVARW